MPGTPWLLAARARAVLQTSALAFGLLSTAEAGASDCHPRAAAFREALEPVVEAVMDGRPAQMLVAARRADEWWATHRAAFASHARADLMMGALRSAVGYRSTTEAAAIAVRTAVASFEWCGAPASDAERLFLLDLAGMTGWLRARGTTLEWPPRVREATEALAARLASWHDVRLAARLRASVTATLGAPAAGPAAAQAATSLLNLVDEIEKVLL